MIRGEVRCVYPVTNSAFPLCIANLALRLASFLVARYNQQQKGHSLHDSYQVGKKRKLSFSQMMGYVLSFILIRLDTHPNLDQEYLKWNAMPRLAYCSESIARTQHRAGN